MNNVDQAAPVVRPSMIITLYAQQFNSVPRGSSEIIHVGNEEGITWVIGFAGIPTYGIMLRILAIMENNIFPHLCCELDVFFNYNTDNQVTMKGVNPHYILNHNTYTDILQFVERCQHHVY